MLIRDASMRWRARPQRRSAVACSAQQAGRKRSAPEPLCLLPALDTRTPASPGAARGGPWAAAPVSDPRLVHWQSALLAAARAQLQQALGTLRSMHQACDHIPDASAQLALGMFRQYVAHTGLGYEFASLQPAVMRALVASCLWVAIKFLAIPGVVPNARWMAQCCGASAGLVLDWEPRVLAELGWDVMGICRALGLTPAKPLADSEPICSPSPATTKHGRQAPEPIA